MKNREQSFAISYNKGPLLIIAGAGTGKTHVLVEKIKYLIAHNLAKPEGILALTFTEKAASEMEERTDQAMPYGYVQMWISTFHSFCDQILKEHAAHIGLNPGYRLLTDAEAVLFLKENLFLFHLNYFRPLGNPHKYLEGLHTHFSRLKDEDVSPEQYLKWAKSQKTETEKNIELAHAYQTYQQLKIKQGCLDFSDLIFHTVQLFRKRKNILAHYQKKFSHVLVDEFQDTNIAQYVLIKLLCPSKKNPKLTMVGDDSQAIYKFRGASVSNIMAFRKDYPKTRQVTLKKNYRSNQTILNAAYKLIKHNDPDTLEVRLGISKNLIAQKKDAVDALSFSLKDRVEEEADVVTQTILGLRKTYRFADIAILTRANNHADPFVRALSRKGIPYQFLGPGNLFKQPEVKDLIAYLKFLNTIDDSISFYRVVSMDIFNLDAKDIASLISFARKINASLFQSLEIYLSFFYTDLSQKEFSVYKKYIPHVKQNTRDSLYATYCMIQRHLSLMKKETAGQILYFFLEDTKYLNVLVSYKTEREEKIALNISKFFNKLKAFESDHEDASVPAVVDYIDMSMELGESPTASQTDLNPVNAVNILTVHSAKGLEFPVVFMVNLSRGRFPTYERRELIPIPDALIKETLPVGDYHLEEERRLFYVGMTRAMDKLYLSTSQYYGEAKRQQRISPFVIEALGEKMVERFQKISEEKKSQLAMFAFEKPVSYHTKSDRFLQPTHTFSYSQLETYERCPLQYKYQYVLRLPTTQNAAASFGDTIHKTLQTFYKEFMTDKTVGLKRLLGIYKETWIPIGYASKAHEARVKQEGESMLRTFLKTFHTKDFAILDLERLFKIKIDKQFTVTGKIDRVDKKNKQEIEIIDYKTGKMPEEREQVKSLQLSIYTLAAMDRGLYHKKFEEITLSFYYLSPMKKVSFKPAIKQVEDAKEAVRKISEDVNKRRFDPHVGPWCDFCAFRMICEAWQ